MIAVDLPILGEHEATNQENLGQSLILRSLCGQASARSWDKTQWLHGYVWLRSLEDTVEAGREGETRIQLEEVLHDTLEEAEGLNRLKP